MTELASDNLSNRHFTWRTFTATIFIAVVAVGCASARQPLPARTPYPVSSSVIVLPIATEAPASIGTRDPPVGCPMANFGTIELVTANGANRFVEQQTRQPLNLVWPRGFQLVSDHGVAELLAPDGSVVIKAGQSRSDFVGGGDHVCSVGGVIYPPSS